jgi:hypothetical protein
MTGESRKWNDVSYVVLARKEFETLVTRDIEYFKPRNYRIWLSQDGTSVDIGEVTWEWSSQDVPGWAYRKTSRSKDKKPSCISIGRSNFLRIILNEFHEKKIPEARYNSSGTYK